MEKYSRIGKFLKEHRIKLNLSQSELAKKLGITEGSISNYELGKCEPPKKIRKKLVRLLKLSYDDKNKLRVEVYEDTYREIEEKWKSYNAALDNT
jgi:transcriptional regulator with XRE-family HTH domain